MTDIPPQPIDPTNIFKQQIVTPVDDEILTHNYIYITPISF
jgi:hypothetical protein